MFLNKMENAHSQIDSLLNMDFLKNRLTKLSGLQNKYKFGSEGQGIFQNNIINALVDAQLGNKNMEDLLKFSIGGKLGRDNQWASMFQGGKGWGKFNLSRSF